MTQEQTRRVIQSLDETNRCMDREMSYMPQHRDQKLISFCEKHIAKLVGMLEGARA